MVNVTYLSIIDIKSQSLVKNSVYRKCTAKNHCSTQYSFYFIFILKNKFYFFIFQKNEERTFVVQRQYEDFEWLEHCLLTANPLPGLIVRIISFYVTNEN